MTVKKKENIKPSYLDYFTQFKPEELAGYVVIIDDTGNNKEVKEYVNTLFTVGRHNHIDVIYIDHDVVDFNPISRGNLKEVYITIGNTSEFLVE